jgi:hypothetical protein
MGSTERTVEMSTQEAVGAGMDSVSYEILEAMVQCFGKAFHYKDGVAAFFATAGIPMPLVDKHRGEAKFVWARRLLTELGESEHGRLLQRKVLSALCRLRNLPDKEVSDRDGGLAALKHLKSLVGQNVHAADNETETRADRESAALERVRQVDERRRRLEALRETFNASVVEPNRQAAGYTLQDVLSELFALSEIEYRKSYRTTQNTQEIDGHFLFQSFDYLVEAKWRKDQPTDAEIGAFKHKVEGKLAGTRGLFVSVQGFRPEVVSQFDQRGSSIILLDGFDLIHILEGRVDLRDALRKKIECAAQKGQVLTPVYP